MENASKNSLPGHDTVSHLVIDGTTIVALLTDLSDLQKCFPSHHQPGSQRKFPKLEASSGDILRKIPRSNLQSFRSNLGYTFHGQEAYLPMPVTGVGITL